MATAHSKKLLLLVIFFLISMFVVSSLKGPVLLTKNGESRSTLLVFYVDKTLLPLFSEVETSLIPQLEQETGTDIEIRYVLGSSGFVLSQLNLTKKGDLYASDDFYFARVAVDKGLIEPSEARIIAYIELAIFLPEGSDLGIKGLRDLVYYGKKLRVAIGDPSHVSAGKLAEELLVEHGLWRELFNRHEVILAPSASDVANLVKQGAVDAGITFNVFGKNIDGIHLIEIEEEYNTRVAPVVLAPTKFTEHKDLVTRIIEYMASENFGETLAEYGFFTREEIGEKLPHAIIPELDYITGKD